jgi:hypothetical protein
MSPIAWPESRSKINPMEAPIPVLLPELTLTKADYEAAAEAYRKLDDCCFEVVFLHEVAARHCRERQLAAALSRDKTVDISKQSREKAFLKQRQTPTPISRFASFRENLTPFSRPNKLP